MTCRQCGTEIAAKAIICYKCGAPTAVPAAPVRAKATRGVSPLLWVVIVAVVAAAAYVIWRNWQ
jgi:hypothetical protein